MAQPVAPQSVPKLSLPALLKGMVEQDASDLHLTVNSPPQYRIQGKMVRVKADTLSGKETKEMAYSVMTDLQKLRFEKQQELDFSFGIKDLARFRANIFYQRNDVGVVFRKVPFSIPEFDTLNLPIVMRRLLKTPNGLILVTGPTGSGKSTSLAAMIDVINREEFGHIITVEDPIEFLHPHKNCIVNQREVGSDTDSFASALKRILRQDPDYILVGEMRDKETIESALTLAETGHLVFGTLHTNNAIQAVNRIINVFPTHQQPQIRQVLSFSLSGIMAQQLIRSESTNKMHLATEVMIPNVAIRNLIRDDKLHQIYSSMQSGQSESGMHTMNQSLHSLVRTNKISKEEAMYYSASPDELEKLLMTLRG